jgi:hypothetical protein
MGRHGKAQHGRGSPRQRGLTGQHEQLRAGFAQVVASSGEERLRSFTALGRVLAGARDGRGGGHTPRARTALPTDTRSPPAWVRSRRSNAPWAALQKQDVDSQAFATGLTRLRSDVLAHTAARSSSSSPSSPLPSTLDAEQLAMMRRAVELAEGSAPPHPHLASAAATARPDYSPPCWTAHARRSPPNTGRHRSRQSICRSAAASYSTPRSATASSGWSPAAEAMATAGPVRIRDGMRNCRGRGTHAQAGAGCRER